MFQEQLVQWSQMPARNRAEDCRRDARLALFKESVLLVDQMKQFLGEEGNMKRQRKSSQQFALRDSKMHQTLISLDVKTVIVGSFPCATPLNERPESNDRVACSILSLQKLAHPTQKQLMAQVGQSDFCIDPTTLSLS